MARGSGAIVEVERLGGLAGFGGVNSRLRSRGRVALDDLADDERAAVEALFTKRAGPPKSAARDAFRYRLTRTLGATSQVVEVLAAEVPAALAACVKDELL